MKKLITEILEFEIEDNRIIIRDNYISEEEMDKKQFWEFIKELQEMYKKLI